MLRFDCAKTPVLLLLIPLLASGTPRLMPSCPSDTGKSKSVGFYYNLKGEKIYLPGDTLSKGMIVLSRSKEPTIIAEKVRQHMILDIPSTEVLDSMTLAYHRSDSSKHEFLFLVGKRGRISLLVEGSDTSVETKPARIDLDQEKSDEPAYTVHVHENYPESGITGDYRPSGIDREKRNFRDRQQASIVLGYTNDHLWQMISFYYLDNIENVTFSDFYNLVKKITADPPK
jgi:hypothetical protein